MKVFYFPPSVQIILILSKSYVCSILYMQRPINKVWHSRNFRWIEENKGEYHKPKMNNINQRSCAFKIRSFSFNVQYVSRFTYMFIYIHSRIVDWLGINELKYFRVRINERNHIFFLLVRTATDNDILSSQLKTFCFFVLLVKYLLNSLLQLIN